ncbi:hypothetical protein RJ640_025229 [Escallonia rubra]|uniref:Uncharacterized protein n=1 Tax=Escallonia rubra TaxID=112253 RepID=A0AA88S638_9ASTE|nr:hypothetical protein RJ640_025229 [Escallonia rubra]
MSPHPLLRWYRMSFDSQRMLKRVYTKGLDSRFNSSSSSVWKVKLVIRPERLLEILSQEVRTRELFENVRTVAKCGNGVSSVVAFSDQWSLTSSRNASSKKDGLDGNNGLNVIVAPNGEDCLRISVSLQNGHALTIFGIQTGPKQLLQVFCTLINHIVR